MPKTEQVPKERYERQRQKSVAQSRRGKLNKQATSELLSLRRAVDAGIAEADAETRKR